MIDISTTSVRFNHKPNLRKRRSRRQKLVIVVTGRGDIGKSYMCQALLNTNISYVSVDIAMQTDNWKNFNTIKDFFAIRSVKKARRNMHMLYHYIKKTCCDVFVAEFFRRYVLENDKLFIIVDGSFFAYRTAIAALIEQGKQNGVRIWFTKRLI